MSAYRFNDHELDPQARTLSCAGRVVSIEPRVFDVVVYLVEQRQRAVGRDELIAAAWGRADCSDATLAQAILKARRLFGDSGETQRTIRTVARFGYQWVAPVQTAEPRVMPIDEASVEPASQPAWPAAVQDLPVEPDETSIGAAPVVSRVHRASSRPWLWSIAVVCIALVVGGAFWRSQRNPRPTDETHPNAGLVLVAPATVHSAVAQDGWMRLGLMAMSADALRGLPGYSLVANETVLAAISANADVSPTRLRELTGATTIVSIDAHRNETRWVLDASVMAADGRAQMVSVEDTDAVAAAAALAQRLRGALGGSMAESEVSAGTLAVTARMQAAILEGHAERALALADAADPHAAAPEIALWRAGALNRLGNPDEATIAMRTLIERAGRATPAWLAPAWKTLGYGEMLRGHADTAADAFRHAIAAAGNDRGEAARAWRGLGNAQAMNGAFAEAEASSLRARLELGDGGDPLLRAHLEDDLGSVAGHRGRYDDAIAHYRQAATTAAAVGAVELELGSRMNIALSEAEQLHHAEALASWRELLPRLQAVDYPSMQRYAAVHYAQALAETGALVDAQTELERTRTLAGGVSRDALDDAEIDALRVEWMLGDSPRLRDEARHLAEESHTASRRAAAAGILVLSDLAAGDTPAAQNDSAALKNLDPGEDRSTRAAALAAVAALQAHTGADGPAETSYGDALALVRESGSPRDLREIALPYAAFQLDHDKTDAARTTAGLLQPYADEDFAITLLLARLATGHDAAEANRLYTRARALAGARPLPAEAAPHPVLAIAMPRPQSGDR